MGQALFNYSGLASVDDLDSKMWQAYFLQMEAFQNRFLEHEAQFRSADYKWTRDPLHNFSRIWEYPYVYHHLRGYLSGRREPSRPVAVDVGSGVTFFPFIAAAEGYQVVAVDIDPVGRRDYPLACRALGFGLDSVTFRLADARAMPFENGAVDAAWSISLLEHMEEPERSITELARVVKPGGLLAITMDISLEGRYELGADKFLKVTAELQNDFRPAYPERTVHPLRLLTSRTSRIPRPPDPTLFQVVLDRPLHYLGQVVLRPAISARNFLSSIRDASRWYKPHLPHVACYCYVGTRK